MKKKILFLTVAFDKGGTEKVTLDIINNLNPEKYDITLMTMYNGGLYQSKLKPHITVRYFFPRFIRFAIRYVTLFPGTLVYKTFIKEKYDVEIACGDDIPSRVINHSPNKNSKKIAWIHMDVMKRGYKGYEMKTKFGRRRFYRNFDVIVNVSRECQDRFIERFGNEVDTRVIYNPIPSDEVIRKSQEKTKISFNKSKFNIVCIGRLTDQKGFDRLLEAQKRLLQEGINKQHIYIIGDGYEKKSLMKFIKENDLEDSVELVGFLDNPYPLLKQGDLFLLSSRDESFSLVVAEAMVLGIPIMSTRCTGPNELLKQGERGLLVNNNIDGIYGGLKDILTNEEFYLKLKDKAYANIGIFDFNKQIHKIENLLDEE